MKDNIETIDSGFSTTPHVGFKGTPILRNLPVAANCVRLKPLSLGMKADRFWYAPPRPRHLGPAADRGNGIIPIRGLTTSTPCCLSAVRLCPTRPWNLGGRRGLRWREIQ